MLCYFSVNHMSFVKISGPNLIGRSNTQMTMKITDIILLHVSQDV